MLHTAVVPIQACLVGRGSAKRRCIARTLILVAVILLDVLGLLSLSGTRVCVASHVRLEAIARQIAKLAGNRPVRKNLSPECLDEIDALATTYRRLAMQLER
jgi:hypothetical protein